MLIIRICHLNIGKYTWGINEIRIVLCKKIV